MSSENLGSLKISEEAFAANSIENMSTIPSRPSAFGASALTPEDVKKRFDANGNLIREKFNDLLDMLPEIAGELKVTVKLTEEERVITLAELAAALSDTKGNLQMQNILKVTYGGEDKTIKEIVEALTKGISDVETKEDLQVDKMSVIDEKRIKAYEEDGGYYFSENNWKAFIGDETSGKFGYNRVYVERSKGRGTYGMYALSPHTTPIYNAWYSKDEWAERFAKEHPGETSREPYDNEYPLLDSIPQRSNNGHISVPLTPTESHHAVSLFYANQLRDACNSIIEELMDEFNGARDEFNSIIEEYNQKFIEMRNDVYAGTLGLAYELSEDGKCYISTGLGDVPEGSDIEIAAYYEGLPVTEVAEGAFQNKTFTSVRIPTTITKFGRNAFGWSGKTTRVYIKDIAKWCEATFELSATPVTHSYPSVYIKGRYLEHLEIPEGVTSISQRAFMQWAQFKSITLPKTLNTLNSMSFQYCEGLEFITIPSSVTDVDSSAFGFCSALKTVAFEGKPNKIIPTAFEKDDALTDIYVPWSEGEVANAPWGAVNATVHYNCYGTEGLAYTLSNDGTYAICTGIGTATDTNIVIGSQYRGVPVTEIKAKAFVDNSTLTDVIIPDSVTSIGNGAFYNCSSLAGIHLSKSLRIIPTTMCCRCEKLTMVEIPDSVKTISFDAFSTCDLRQIVVPKNVTSIEGYAFAFNNNLRTVIIKGNVTSIGAYAFVEAAAVSYRPIDIYVPWSKDEVSGAPWGATNAIIHYNSEV